MAPAELATDDALSPNSVPPSPNSMANVGALPSVDLATDDKPSPDSAMWGVLGFHAPQVSATRLRKHYGGQRSIQQGGVSSSNLVFACDCARHMA